MNYIFEYLNDAESQRVKFIKKVSHCLWLYTYIYWFLFQYTWENIITRVDFPSSRNFWWCFMTILRSSSILGWLTMYGVDDFAFDCGLPIYKPERFIIKLIKWIFYLTIQMSKTNIRTQNHAFHINTLKAL